MAGQGTGSLSAKQGTLTRRTVFFSTTVHPLTLDALLEEKYQADWILWEPETLWSTLAKDFDLKSPISHHCRAGIQCVKTLHANDTFFLDWQVTNWCTLALDGVLPDFEVLQIPLPGQIMHAVTCSKLLRGEMPFDDEVQGWMAACFADDGLVYAPQPVEFIQDDLVRVEAHCTKCGNVEWAKGLTECPSCGEPRDTFRLAPRYEWRDIADRWLVVKGMPSDSVELKEDRPGVQLAKLLVARDHVDMRMQQLDQELKNLGFGDA